MQARGTNKYWGAADSTDLVAAITYVFDRTLGGDDDESRLT